jgi:hypothetical protein
VKRTAQRKPQFLHYDFTEAIILSSATRFDKAVLCPSIN